MTTFWFCGLSDPGDDRSNKAVDLFEAATDKFAGRAGEGSDSSDVDTKPKNRRFAT